MSTDYEHVTATQVALLISDNEMLRARIKELEQQLDATEEQCKKLMRAPLINSLGKISKLYNETTA